MKDAAGNITHLVSVVKDITERKKREEQELELRMAQVVQQRLYPKASPEVPGFDIAGGTIGEQFCGEAAEHWALVGC